MTNTSPKPDIDLAQISTRNTHARHIVVGCASALPSLADMWQALDDALSDTVALAAQVTRLSAELDRVRLDRANLRAAMRATLAPAGVAAGLVAAAWWLHHTRPHWWPLLAVLTGVATWAVALFGARWRFPTRIERVYAAVTVYAGGTWLSAATAVGPSVPLLREALVIGAVILSVPWWAHRRRRAKVALERKLQAWPDIAKAIGLAGTEVMSATVDVWGWRARFRLARGQTIKDIVAKIPAIESGLGTFRGAVRVHPTPDDLAHRCEIRVLEMDPHAGAIPWPGPSLTSITQPIDLG